jgi:DNA repair exonuclease SbcCD ATPase subunit
MRLRQLKIAGFRGFNVEQTIDFHERLTLISAPNSHGKTSITEALEFLIYGETSKVAHAQSKEEYKDSYRNRHFSSTQPAIIETTCDDPEDGQVVFRVELDASGTLRRFVNGLPVAAWPFSENLSGAARPFVVQHALKNLLAVAPSERFQGFARLLGLVDVDVAQQAIVNLCTKPEASIPEKAKKALADFQILEGRLVAFPELQAVAKDFKRNLAGVEPAYKKLRGRADKLLGGKLKVENALTELIAAREKAAAKVYSGTVAIGAMTPQEEARLLSLRESIVSGVSAPFITTYAQLAARDATERLQKEATLLQLGRELLADIPDSCPLCGQALNDDLRNHIAERHTAIKSKLGGEVQSGDPRDRIARELTELQSSIMAHRQGLDNRCNDLLSAAKPENQSKIKTLFGKDNEASWEIVRSTANTVETSHDELANAETEVRQCAEKCRTALQGRNEDINQAEELARSVQQYLMVADALRSKLDELTPVLAGPAHLLRLAIDTTAGTTELSILIEFLEKKAAVERVLRIREVMEGLKDLKKHTEQTVGEVMEGAFSADLTGSVMSWYAKIRTSGDPDVHFSGFSMERTKSGDFKSRRVRVGAKSYGIDLASAVSSLSESKLNALGLCMSIATAVRSPGPWGFLMLDDPIQSWDADHETQFVNVIRSLAEQENKQVILLSHRNEWIEQVAHGCRTLNGTRHIMTGYTKDGPHISQVEWASVDQRLKEVHSIVSDPKASTVRLQQAEEEIRIAACQLTADIAKKKLARDKGPHSINSNDARAILNQAGCPTTLLDRVIQTFGTTDKAHHTPKDYQPNVERIRQYYGTLNDLKKWGET